MTSCKPERHGRYGACARGIFALLLAGVAFPSAADQPADCKFAGLALPADFAVLAGGEYSGRPLDIQIDQSGHQATQMDVVVNYPEKPVVLILGAYEPTIWNVRWTRKTRILAVVTGGYHRQGVAGLPKSLPLQVRSYEDKSPCGYFYVGGNDLRALNPLSRNMFGKNVDMVYLAKNGALAMGDPVPAGESLETSRDTAPESFVDRKAPLAGPAGLRDAVEKGLIRPATAQDAEDWEKAVLANTPAPDVPPVAGQPRRSVQRPMMFNAYVVLKPFTFPSGLYGGHMATFLIPKGVPRPQGNPGHSDIYDFNTLGCQGPLCEATRNAAPVAVPVVKSAAAAPAGKDGKCSRSDSGSSCLADELRRTDDDINSVYRRVMAGLSPGERKNLRSQQRAWLRSRDAECALSSRVADRLEWIAHVLADNARAVCVVRMTKERLAQLSEMDSRQTGSKAAAEPLKIEATVKSSRSSLDYVKASLESHANGKWYFEIQVDHGKIRKELEATLFIGIQGAESNFGTMYHIRPQDLVLDMGQGDSVTIVGGNLGDDIHLPKITVGIAVDLDNGKLYVRRAGKWNNGAPGSAGGIDVKLGRTYKAGITSSVPLAPLIEQSIVVVNLGGDKPLVDPVPEGYAVFDSSRNAGKDEPVRLASVEVVATGSSVAAQAPAYWIRKYWEWTRSVAADAKPSADPTGARCADRQAGPVWFLTGSESTASVVRTCDVPAGVHVLVPIINVLAQPSPGQAVACEELTQTLRGFGAEVTDLHLKVDGAALPSPSLYRIATGCFELDDNSRGQKGMAAGDGYWVFLRSLPPGRHEIAFGGKFTGDGFTQDIKYLVNVR